MSPPKKPDCWVVLLDGEIIGTHDAPGHLRGIPAERYVPAELLERAKTLLSEVSANFTREDDLPDGLLGRIDELLKEAEQ